MIIGQLLEFEIAFPDETPLSIEEYLKGGSRNDILEVASFLLSFKLIKSKYADNKALLRMIFRNENNQFANNVFRKIDPIEKKGTRIAIINAYSSLKLFEYFFSKTEEAETQTPAEFERNFFKAYLVLNSEFTKTQSKAYNSTRELTNPFKIQMMLFCSQYPVMDKVSYDINKIWIAQIIKAIYLFQFLESHQATRQLLESFLNHFNSATWQDYLNALLPLTVPAIRNELEAHTDIRITQDENFEKSCAFIEKLIVNEGDELDENDFKTLRSKPLYKIQTGVYRIIFPLFVVEKIYKGVYFFLNEVNEKLLDQAKIKNLKSFYGDEFSERTLLYKVLDSIYPDKCVHFSGKELSDLKIDGAPDYFIRKGKNILLFECKDFLIKADKKASFDFQVYEKEFQRVLYWEELPNGKEKHKAVMQLINSIRKLLKNEFKADSDYHYKDVLIYPVLIIHDHQFDTPGFNSLINNWFQDELIILEEEGLFVQHIKPLTVVNIDSLIYHQVGLVKNIPLHEMLKLYHEHTKILAKLRFNKPDDYKQYIIPKLTPFSHFIDKHFKKQGFNEQPPILEIVSPVLFKNESGKQDVLGDSIVKN
jgi:hypothetical protein